MTDTPTPLVSAPETVELKTLMDEATPGEWLYRPDYLDDWGTVKAGPFVICRARDPRMMSDEVLMAHRENGSDPWEHNARLIALAPALAAEVIAIRAEVATLRASEARMREALEWQTQQRADAMARRYMNAPEDPHIEALCERYGYGAVMDAASRLWARKDSLGAFYIGGCIGMKPDDTARAARQRRGVGRAGGGCCSRTNGR